MSTRRKLGSKQVPACSRVVLHGAWLNLLASGDQRGHNSYQRNYLLGKDFYHATRMHSADYVVARCLSIRPPVTRRYCV